MDIVFHYPPDLMTLLVQGIPKLCKSKQDLLDFFQGAGVDRNLLAPHQQLLRGNKAAFAKFEVARALLTQLNAQGERSLGERREILKRVVDFAEFSTCWPDDQLEARGIVAQIRELVNVKDSVTRISLEREQERAKRIMEQEARISAQKERVQRLEKIKNDLFALFPEQDAHRRGKMLEQVLDALFKVNGILVREPFTISGRCGEGIIEQIDGLIEINGILYLVEMKWWNKPIGPGEIAQHLVRVYSRGGQVRGLFISYSDFTPSAVESCRQGLASGAVVVLCLLQEIVRLLESQGDFKEWLKAKVTASIIDKNPLSNPRI